MKVSNFTVTSIKKSHETSFVYEYDSIKKEHKRVAKKTPIKKVLLRQDEPYSTSIALKIYEDGTFSMGCNGVTGFNEKTWEEFNKIVREHIGENK